MQEIKKINVLSVLKVSTLFGVLMAIITSIYMYFVLPGLMAANPLTAASAEVLDVKTLLTVSIGAGIMQLVMMVLVAVLGAICYNLFARWVGGIKVDCVEAHTTRRK
jgi:hypothetical protein